MSVAIVKDDFFQNHSSSWAGEWCATCEEFGLNYELIDWRSIGALENLLRHQQVFWHFSHYSSGEMLFARKMLSALEEAGCKVFPGYKDSWHFDDKVAQAFLLSANEMPAPKNFIFFSQAELETWLASSPVFPVVAKLRTGSGSANVKLLKSVGEVKAFSEKMFGRGVRSQPSLLFKATSNLRSSRSIGDILTRAARLPEFLFSLSKARQLPAERGYVYLQEFIPNATYDIKVVVVRNKLSFIGRHTRSGDFRASGGGDIFYDREIMDERIIDTAFRLSDLMGSECIGLDLVIDPQTSDPLIIEISYGFSHKALLAAKGYFDRSGRWWDEPLNAPREILKNICELGEDIEG